MNQYEVEHEAYVEYLRKCSPFMEEARAHYEQLTGERGMPASSVENAQEKAAKTAVERMKKALEEIFPERSSYEIAGDLQHATGACDNTLAAEMVANIVCNATHDRAEEMVCNFLADHGLCLSESQEHLLIESCCRFLASHGATDNAEKLLWDNLFKAMGHSLASTLSIKRSTEHRDTVVIQTNTASGGVLSSQTMQLGLREATILHNELAKFIDGAS